MKKKIMYLMTGIIVILVSVVIFVMRNGNIINLKSSADKEYTTSKSSDTEKSDTDKKTSEVGNVDGMKQLMGSIKQREGITSGIARVLNDDIDGDGNIEYVICFGDKPTTDDDVMWSERACLIRQKGDAFEEIKAKLDPNGYGYVRADIIKLDNSINKYIYFQISNGAHPLGCSVYKISGDSTITLFNEASATGAGDYGIIDTNSDGIYDGISVEREDYGVQFHKMTIFYKWTGNEFVRSDVRYQLNQYADAPEKVIFQYIDMLWLETNYGANQDTERRINETLMNSKLKYVDISEYVRQLYDFDDYEYPEEGNLKFNQIKTDDTIAQIQADVKKGEIKNKATFDLKFDNGKWRIEGIK